MVKRKSQPKPRTKAGFAARTEQPVHDTTISESSETTDDSSSSSEIPPMSTPIESNKAKSLAPKKANAKPSSGNKLANKSAFKARAKSGAAALKEIKRLQSSSKLIIPRAPFLRVVKEILHSRTSTDFRVTEMAVEALREASENVLTSIFEDAYLVATHAKRVTLFPRDMALVLNLRRDVLSHTINSM